jgi:ubiquinone/menaquinone biosynthesis C-methylase UbiE
MIDTVGPPEPDGRGDIRGDACGGRGGGDHRDAGSRSGEDRGLGTTTPPGKRMRRVMVGLMWVLRSLPVPRHRRPGVPADRVRAGIARVAAPIRVSDMRDARYDAVADFYDAGFSDPRDPVLAALLDLLGSPRGQRVLDLACGHGRVAREVARLGAAVVGVDLSVALLDKARAQEETEHLGVDYVHADAADVPDLPNGSFDAVVCNFGLADIDDLDGALATVRRVLRPGGSFVFSILHPCFAGAAAVAGTWPADRSYHSEGFWKADSAYSVLRRQVGANHRTLSTYVNTASRHGLTVTAMSEPPAPAEWHADERREAARLPVFLVTRCAKG